MKPAREKRGMPTHAVARECNRCAALELELQAAREQLALLRSDLEVAERGVQDAARDLGIAREQCAGLYNFAPNAYVTLDGNGFIRDANTAAADLLGEDRRRLRNKLFIRFVAGRDRRLYLRHLSRCRRSRYPAKTSDDLDVLGADGRRHQVRMLSVPDRESEPPHRLALFRTALMDLSDIRRAENALQESESRYRLLFAMNPCPMFIFDEVSLEFVDVNEAALRLYGYSRDAFLAMTVREIHPAEVVPEVESAIGSKRRLLRSAKTRDGRSSGPQVGSDAPLSAGEWRHVKRDGTVFDVEITVSTISYAGRDAWLALVNDITERKRTEAVLHNLTEELEQRVKDRTAALAQTHRALRVLTECDHALLRTSNEDELLRVACRIAVEVGQYRMAWVGYAEHDAGRTVRPMALVGLAKGYLSEIRVSWADRRLGRGPTGTAIRTGRPAVCRDVTKDPNFKPWRSEALRRGCASILALPLLAEQGCLGALTIYSAQPDAFSDAEIQLLQQLANDLSFGVMALRGREARTRLERQVLDICEREQRRIGQDLHDGVGQSLTGIRYLVSAVQQILADKSAPEAAELERIGQMLGRTQRQAHDLTRGLFPGELRRAGIADALQDLATYTQDVFDVACRFTRLTDAELKDSHVASQMYRIAQEAVTNAAKHSRGKSIEIRLFQQDGCIAMDVRDTGTGISQAAQKTDGMGMRIMKYRADRIGATLRIEGTRGKGTTVTCVLPPIDDRNLLEPNSDREREP